MKKRLLFLALLALSLFLTAHSYSLTGTWKGRITDGGGFMDVSLTLRDDGTGAVGGSLGDVATGFSASFPEYKVTYTTQDGKISFKDEYGELFHFIPIFGVAGDAGLSPKYALSGNTLTIEASEELKLVLTFVKSSAHNDIDAKDESDETPRPQLDNLEQGVVLPDHLESDPKEVSGDWYYSVFNEGPGFDGRTNYIKTEMYNFNGNHNKVKMDIYWYPDTGEIFHQEWDWEINSSSVVSGSEVSITYGNGSGASAVRQSYRLIDDVLIMGYRVFTREKRDPREGYPNYFWVSAPEGLNLRQEASDNSSILEEVEFDTQLLALEKEGKWIKVLFDITSIGYVHGDFLSNRRPTEFDAWVANMDGVFLNPDETFGSKTFLEYREQVLVVDKGETWSQIEQGHGVNWVRSYIHTSDLSFEKPDTATLEEMPAKTEAAASEVPEQVQTLSNLSIGVGESYEFINEYGTYDQLSWENIKGSVSYVVYSQDGAVVESNPYNHNYLGFAYVPKGCRAVITLNEDAGQPLELSYDASVFIVEKSLPPAFLTLLFNAGETYEIRNTFMVDMPLKWTWQTGILACVSYNKNGSLGSGEYLIDAQQQDSLIVPAGGRVLLMLNPDSVTPIIISGESGIFTAAPAPSLTLMIQSIDPGSSIEFENISDREALLQWLPEEGTVSYVCFTKNGDVTKRETANTGYRYTPSSILVSAGGRVVITCSHDNDQPLHTFADSDVFTNNILNADAALHLIEDIGLRKDVMTLFDSYNFAYNFYGDVRLADILKYEILNWKEFAAAFALGDFYSDAVVDAYVNDPFRSKSLLKTIVNRFNGTERPIDITDADDFLKKTDSYFALLDIFIQSGVSSQEISVVKRYVRAADELPPFLTDYSKNIAYLEVLKSTVPSGSQMSLAVEMLILDYKTAEVPGRIIDAVRQGGLKLVDLIFSTKIIAIDTVIQGLFSGDPVLEGLNVVIGLAPVKESLIAALKSAAQRIMDGNRSPDSIRDYVILFNLCRETTILEYESMLVLYSPFSKEANYIEDQISLLKGMTFYNYSPAMAYLIDP